MPECGSARLANPHAMPDGIAGRMKQRWTSRMKQRWTSRIAELQVIEAVAILAGIATIIAALPG